LGRYAFGYGQASRIQQVAGPGGTRNFAYDLAGQLKQVTDDAAVTLESYSYDTNGNRTSGGYTTDPNNRLAEDATYTYQYDAEGNRTQRTKKVGGDFVKYFWDHRNRLTSVEFWDHNTSGTDTLLKEVLYTYDMNDRRIRKEVKVNNEQVLLESYVYDPEDELALVFDETGAVKDRYLHGPAVDQVLADEEWVGGLANVRWPLADHEGTVEQLAEYDAATGTTSIAQRIRYDAFGRVLDVVDDQGASLGASAIDSRFAFTGREWDADAELYYYRARWYDPAAGRFLSEDPIGLAGGDSNFYRYVGNDPVNRTDPSGLRVARPTANLAIPLGFAGGTGIPASTPNTSFDTGNPAFSLAGNGAADFLPLGQSSVSFGGPMFASGTPFDGTFPVLGVASLGAIADQTTRMETTRVGVFHGLELLGETSLGRIADQTTRTEITRVDVLRGLELGEGVRQAANREAAILEANARTTNSSLVAGIDTFRAGFIRLGGRFLGGTVDTILPPSEPSTLISYSNGTRLLIDGGGPRTGALLGQGAAILGVAATRFQSQAARGTIAPESVPHKNSLDYVGDTHVYRIKGPNGTHKIGESAQGVRVRDGASIRAEQQVRRLNREVGPGHSAEIRKTFPDKRAARDYETRVIERFRRMFGDDALPGNKTNR